MYRYNKKILRSLKQRWKPGRWDDPEAINPHSAEARAAFRKQYGGRRWSGLNDQGVVTWAKKRKHHRRHERKPYERHKA